MSEIFDLYQGHYANIDFYLRMENEQKIIDGNVRLLRQVLHNIIKNAIEACESRIGEGLTDYRGKIELTLSNNDNHIILSIADNGIGLSTKDNRIFEPYVTTKEKGTGLGLAIVKKIIQDHKGKVELQLRQENKGSVAIITLPLIDKVETV